MTAPPPFPIVDAHHGFVAAEGAGVAFLPSDLAPLLVEEGVQTTVLVQPEPSAERTRWAVDMADETGFVAAVVPWVDVTAKSLAKDLRALAKSPKLRGICIPLGQDSDNHWLRRDDVIRGLTTISGRGLTVDLLAAPRHLPAVTALAERLPELSIAVCHLGGPFVGRGQREPWGVYMLNLAPHRNVVVKLSGLVTLDARPWSVEHHRGFVEVVVRLFGHERTMFGSDWPEHAGTATYAQVVDAATDAAGPMTAAQRERLLGGTAREFYRLS